MWGEVPVVWSVDGSESDQEGQPRADRGRVGANDRRHAGQPGANDGSGLEGQEGEVGGGAGAGLAGEGRCGAQVEAVGGGLGDEVGGASWGRVLAGARPSATRWASDLSAVVRKRPPGRRTRATSARTGSLSGSRWSSQIAVTASRRRSAMGRRVASAWARWPGRRIAPRFSIAGERPPPWTRWPRAASSAATMPVPTARSRTRLRSGSREWIASAAAWARAWPPRESSYRSASVSSYSWRCHSCGQSMPTSASIRRSSGRERPTTLWWSPSIRSTKGPPRPSTENAPARSSGSPVATYASISASDRSAKCTTVEATSRTRSGCECRTGSARCAAPRSCRGAPASGPGRRPRCRACRARRRRTRAPSRSRARSRGRPASRPRPGPSVRRGSGPARPATPRSRRPRRRRRRSPPARRRRCATSAAAPATARPG